MTDVPPVHRMPLWKAAGASFLAMFAADLLGTAMVVFESHFQPNLAGAMDVAGWLASLICSVLALDSILKHGWRNKRSLVIVASVSAANFAGTWTGVVIGKALVR